MSHVVFERILDQLAPLKLQKICPYLENEPLLDPHIFERIQTIKNELCFDSIEISTNAMALDKNKAERLAALLSDINHEIWISFHGVDKRTYEGCMGLEFDSCLANILYLLNISDEKQLNIIIRGGGMPMENVPKHDFTFTQREFHDFWNRVFQENGIKTKPKLNYFRYHDRAGTIRRNDIRSPEIVRRDLRGFQCGRLKNWLHFLYTGELTICCMDYHREEVFADIGSQAMEAILAGPYRDLRDKVEGRVQTSDTFICKRCIYPEGTGKKISCADSEENAK